MHVLMMNFTNERRPVMHKSRRPIIILVGLKIFGENRTRDKIMIINILQLQT